MPEVKQEQVLLVHVMYHDKPHFIHRPIHELSCWRDGEQLSEEPQ